jgi:ferredoxin
MPTVRFASIHAAPDGRGRSARLSPDLVVVVEGRERLLDICDESHAPVAFSCRGATCATCRVAVLEGEALLEPPEEAERVLLASVGAPPETRLACQAVVRAGPGVVRLRWGG